jgi:hypothetical protein
LTLFLPIVQSANHHHNQNRNRDRHSLDPLDSCLTVFMRLPKRLVKALQLTI